MSDPSFCLSVFEKRAYAEEGFFIRTGAFAEDEVDDIRDAVECCAARASAAAAGGRTYQIDGNVYCEASGATIQFEHLPGTKTIRVIEPFHPTSSTSSDPARGRAFAGTRILPTGRISFPMWSVCPTS